MRKYEHSWGWYYPNVTSAKNLAVLEFDERLGKYRCEMNSSSAEAYIGYCSETELDEKYTMLHKTKNATCTCGAAKLGHPGHSYWCDYGKDKY